MPKQVFDLIQRMEIEDGVPRVISATINWIGGGVDLLSHARAKLNELRFTDKFEENKTSQYVGYRVKRVGKGVRRYSLVLAQRKDTLLVSFPKDFIDTYLLTLRYQDLLGFDAEDAVGEYTAQSIYWIRPSKEDIFFAISKNYRSIFCEEVSGTFDIDPEGLDPNNPEDCQIVSQDMDLTTKQGLSGLLWNHNSFIKKLWGSGCGLSPVTDTLFPYCHQFYIHLTDELDELLTYFIPELMEY